MPGTVDRYVTKAGERRWRIRWDLPAGPTGDRRQRARRGFRTKKEAEAALLEILNDQHNRGRETIRSGVTLGEYAVEWLEGRRDLKATSVDNLRTAIHAHVVPRLGARRVQDVTPEDVASLYVDLAERGKRGVKGCRTAGVTCPDHDCSPDRHGGLSPKSIGHVHAAVRAVLAQAVEDGLVATNPADSKRARQARPKGGRTVTRVSEDMVWSDEQSRQFVAATGDDWYGALWTTLLGTGLRRGEVLALQWDDVDLDGQGTLTVRRSVTTVRGQIVADDDGGKTDAARRVLVLGPDLVETLRAHRKRQTERRLAAGPVWQDTGVVFVEDDGQPIHPNRASSLFTRAADEAGLPPIGLHGLRHTHATMLLRAGVPIPAVAQRLGHASAAITLQVYAHALPADDALAADATSRTLFGTVSA